MRCKILSLLVVLILVVTIFAAPSKSKAQSLVEHALILHVMSINSDERK